MKILSSKARTLEALQKQLKNSSILPLFYFQYREWCENRPTIVEKVLKKEWKRIIVRSSSTKEDSFEKSAAGEFTTIGNIEGGSHKAIAEAIEEVFRSYGELLNSDDEVLIQPYLQSVELCGVGVTVDMETLSPYYVLNYDISGSTDSITSGTATSSHTYVQFKEGCHPSEDERINRVILALKELETLCNYNYLDVEFAYSEEVVYILQVRPIVILSREAHYSRIDLNFPLRKIAMKVEHLSKKHPEVLGDQALFSVMTDWNPAEMIGLRPRQLAKSLYRELITDQVWAEQRYNYGYRNVLNNPLLIDFMGLPYIDVRCSLNSFIPASLSHLTAEKLIAYYISRILEKPELHDKVEFEIVFSCYYPGVERKIENDLSPTFSSEEISEIIDSLKKLTELLIGNKESPFYRDIEITNVTEKKFDQIRLSDMDPLDKIFWLIENGKTYGTLPFAGLARGAFIATQLLNGMANEQLITEDEKELFLSGLHSIPEEIACDLIALSREDFVAKYGHLRPGTYDITVDNYAQGYDHYFKERAPYKERGKEGKKWSSDVIARIEKWLSQAELNFDGETVALFMKKAIEYREEGKFLFTKSVNEILELLAVFGKDFGFTREDLSFIDIQQLKRLYSSLNHQNMVEILSADIEKNRLLYKYSKTIKLPSVITSQEDIYRFLITAAEPNFVTNKSISAEITDLPEEACGKILFIDSSDPGYDYVFGYNIGALITKYGGVNSHMAIRCSELGIPAVIGAGEALYEEWRSASALFVDCSAKKVVKV